MSIKEDLIKKFKNKAARVGVVGLGYVGLPLAVVFAEAGFKVTGIDPAKHKIEKINRGESYIPDVSTEVVAKLVKQGALTIGRSIDPEDHGCSKHLRANTLTADRRSGYVLYPCRYE